MLLTHQSKTELLELTRSEKNALIRLANKRK